jgi:glycosyltransferase involved in cell wall biosynthesis
MKKKSLLIVGNGFITKENQDFFKDKHTSKFLKDCSVLFSRVGWLEPVDKVDPTKNTSIHKAKIPQEILLINSKVEVALNPFLKLIRLVSLAYFFLLYFKKFHFIYFFFFGNLSWICAFIAVFFKKPYGLYLRSEVQLKSFFNRFIINRAEFVLVNGKGLLESLKGLNQNTKLVAPMLDINTEDVYSRNMRKNIKVLKALFVGRIEERKGVFDILEAIKMLKRDGCIVECYFIGGGDDFICLQNKAEEYDLEKQIKLLGVIHEKKKL